MSRKDVLRGPVAVEPVTDRPARMKVRPMLGAAPPAEASASTRLTSQVGNAFAESKARFERAEDIERRLAEGQAVIDMDPSSIDPSFVQDRMESDIAGLVDSMREQGQQVPILVRPHPETEGRYQVAFGHRRLRAMIELGRSVKAIVRDLSDEQLVIAQGQENNEREDLTFIEKARFAHSLNRQFSRDIITSSMSLDKSDLSKMLLIIDAIPAHLIEAIGRAPGVGRRSWLDMAAFVEKASDPNEIVDYARSKPVQDLDSAERFKTVLLMKSKRPARALPDVMSAPAGDRLAQVKQNKTKLEIVIDKRATPDFATFVLQHVPALYEEYRAKLKPQTGD